jgi:hypothetical protein
VPRGLTKTGNPARQKHGGRVAGSPSRQQISLEMLGDVLHCYQQLGGVEWLCQWAAANETDFVKQVLSRILPVPYQEPADPQTVTNILNVNDPASVFRAAQRVAFALALAGQTLEAEPARTAEHSEPVAVTPDWPAPRWLPPEPVPYDAAASAEELRRTVAEQKTEVPVHYGSAAEQGIRKKGPR